MSFLKRITHIVNLSKSYEFKPLPQKSDKRFSYQLKRSFSHSAEETGQQELKNAIIAAEDPENPTLYYLLQICKRALEDFHLRMQIRTAINEVVSEPAFLCRDGKPDDKISKLLHKRWFEDCLKMYLQTEFWPHSLIEFHKLIDQGEGLEISKVKLFPREHVNPFTKELLLTPFDTSGIPYTDPKFNKWYLECNEMDYGDSEQLGLIAIAAKYSIYKFYSLSDWSRRSEKYGSPILDYATDETDEQELQKKEDMAANFGNNSFLVRDKDDEVTLIEPKAGGDGDIYKSICDYMDAQNSKGINGQTGTSDEKAFVGGAEVHERILGTYTTARLRSLMYWVNDKLIPYLVNLENGQTAYAALKGYEWVPLEILREKQKNDPNKPLEAPGTPPDPNEDPNKPKGKGGPNNSLGKPQADSVSALHTDVKNLYKLCCGTQVLNSGDIANDVVTRAVDRVYKRKLKRGDVDADLFQAQASEIWKGAKDGFASNLKDFKYGSNAHLLHHQLKYNSFVFAAFKVQHNVLDMHAQLFDGSGKLKTRNQFVKDVAAINKDYNKNWLKAEYNLAKSQARMGAYYVKYKDRGGFFVFKTIADGRVREEHKVLHNTKLPVEHSFWLTYWPPLGWGCRCYVIWVSSGEEKGPEGLPNVEGMFAKNAGIDGKIFGEEHPFFEIDRAFAETMVNFLSKNAPEKPSAFAEKIALYERYKNDADYRIKGTFKDSGGFVGQHVRAHTDDLTDNLKAAKLIAEKKGLPVVIREHLEIEGSKNPEYLIMEEISDLKTPKKLTDTSIANQFQKAQERQNLNQLVLNITLDYDRETLLKGIDRGFRNRKKIDKVLMIYKEKVFWITRQDYDDGIINDLIEKAIK